ncbi:MAG: DNA polymerase I [Saprospiraceae bacterium]|nr:DNA polymerase I [Saprospiraceae bacterium]
MSKKLFLLDGHALVYRAHFAFITRPLINSKGLNTSAIAGFMRTLWDLMQNQKPSHLAVAFDLPTPTFRHIMYEPYKAHREAQPEDITIAFPYIEKILKAFHIPVITKENYEADDVIGTIAKQASKEGFTVYMVTPDKDYCQLVEDNILVYKPARSGNEVEILGIPEVLSSWNIKEVSQVIDILGLQGDSVDNIPGVPGIGPKTAQILLEKYGTIENIIANVEELKGKQAIQIAQFAEQALLSKKLATIITDVPIEFCAKNYHIDPPDLDQLSEIFKELEFRTLATSILGTYTEKSSSTKVQQVSDSTSPKPSQGKNNQLGLFDDNKSDNIDFAPALQTYSVVDKNISNTPHTYHLIETKEDILALADKLRKLPEFCFDTETTAIDPNEAEIVGISFAWEKSIAYYVPLPEQRSESTDILMLFKDIFNNSSIKKIGQNIKYDIIILSNYGIDVKGNIEDTMMMHYLLEPDLRHGMDYMAQTLLGYSPVPIENLIGKKGKNQKSMRDVPIKDVTEYAAEDADITLQLYHELATKLKDNSVENLYQTIETPLIYVLADMESAGVRIDANYLSDFSRTLAQSLWESEQKIYEAAGTPFNISSPKQVGEILFEHLKINYRWKKTSTGQYSTDEEIMTELALENEIVAQILHFRGLSKLKSTYVDALPKMINPKTNRVHTSYNQALALTGRLSSQNPNLQNIPIRTEEGRKVRKAFIPRDENHVLLSADYSQIELRLIAEISGDEAMIEAFQAGHDIHQATAAKVYNVPLDQVTSEQRRNAKTVNFSIIYGAGAFNLSGQLGIKRAEAKELIDQYFKQYTGLKDYMEKIVAFAREHGYVETLLKRKRYLRDIHSRNGMIRSASERIAVNTPIQGTAADMIKIAMVNIHKKFTERQLKSKMILQVHDELVFDVLKSEIDEVKLIVEDCMRTAIPNLKVPILVGIGTGENWLEAH